jgi:hypothetical protein
METPKFLLENLEVDPTMAPVAGSLKDGGNFLAMETELVQMGLSITPEDSPTGKIHSLVMGESPLSDVNKALVVSNGNSGGHGSRPSKQGSKRTI